MNSRVQMRSDKSHFIGDEALRVRSDVYEICIVTIG